ncbi:MAG: nucleoside kinase [Clostridia bacterium]|nr:nucleoside kinase [Clostridia bacterium]
MAELELSVLNEMLISNPRGVVENAEREYHERIAGIAEYITAHSSIRILLLAGPSGSGKTTSANLIKDAIEDRGEECLVVSLDDFYRDFDDPDYPKTETGERDFERPESLHLELISRTLLDIADGREFCLPKYDFKQARRTEMRTHHAMPEGCVIIEGLHAMNPKIYSCLDSDKVLKLFVSVSTNINVDGVRILSGRKLRFLRRMTRDSIYRGADAERTLEMWRGVLAAEDVYLYPYKADADIAFDTFHAFEVGVMKKYAERLISPALAKENEYAGTVLSAVRRIAPLEERLIPENSLIKEFIPGGIYEDLY